MPVPPWEHRDRLTSVTTFSATGTKLAPSESTYDLFDRRIARKIDADGNGVFETTQRFLDDGEELILAFSGSTNVLTNRQFYGPVTDENLADEWIAMGTTSMAGTVTWSLGDNLGTIRDLVQYNAATGTTTVDNHVRYDTFGLIVSHTNSQFQPWFAYTGRAWDLAASLSFHRARWYDPRAGRFLSEDPLGFAAGDVNLSRYVGNGATLWVNPSGKTLITPGLGVGGGFVVGGVVGGVMAVGSGLWKGDLTWGKVSGGIRAGAVSGAVTAGLATADPLVIAVIGVGAFAGGVGAAAGSIVEQGVDHGHVDPGKVVTDTVGGTIGGVVGAPVGHVLGKKLGNETINIGGGMSVATVGGSPSPTGAITVSAGTVTRAATVGS